jgi:hypothetical protein
MTIAEMAAPSHEGGMLGRPLIARASIAWLA